VKSVISKTSALIRLIADDEVACSLLEKLLTSTEAYFRNVFEMETRLKIARLRLEEVELRELNKHLDEIKWRAHEALIADLHIFNRYVIKEFGPCGNTDWRYLQQWPGIQRRP